MLKQKIGLGKERGGKVLYLDFMDDSLNCSSGSANGDKECQAAEDIEQDPSDIRFRYLVPSEPNLNREIDLQRQVLCSCF